MTRIKYTQTNPWVSVSNPILHNTQILNIAITAQFNVFQYRVFNLDDYCILGHGEAKTLAKAKRESKNILKNIGVEFQPEVRKRTKND